MGKELQKRLVQTRFESPFAEAVLNVLVTASHLRELFDRSYAEHELSHGQYNVLRILRGAHPEGYPRCEIARRMIERAPDLTRLVDRLERRGLVERARSEEDRRHSITRITRKGLELLERLQPTMNAAHREVADHLTRGEAEELSRLCEKLYGEG